VGFSELEFPNFIITDSSDVKRWNSLKSDVMNTGSESISGPPLREMLLRNQSEGLIINCDVSRMDESVNNDHVAQLA
jgi:hypothetical protein